MKDNQSKKDKNIVVQWITHLEKASTLQIQ